MGKAEIKTSSATLKVNTLPLGKPGSMSQRTKSSCAANMISRTAWSLPPQQCDQEERQSPALVEGVDGDLDLTVFPQQFGGVFICVEGVHQHQRHVYIVHFVQVLQTHTTHTHKHTHTHTQTHLWKSITTAKHVIKTWQCSSPCP